MIAKLPAALTTAVPISVPCALTTRTVLPGSPRPVRVVPSALTASWEGSTGAVMSGAVIDVGIELWLAASMATVSRVSPLACGGCSVMMKEPFAAAMALPSSVPSAPRTSTRFPGVARPVSCEPSAFSVNAVGLVGAGVAGTVKLKPADVLPAASVWVRLRVWPALAGVSSGRMKVPFAATTPAPMMVPFAPRTSTVAPASPRPERVRPSALTTMFRTTSGAVMSGTWNANGEDALPAASVWRTSMNSPLAWAGFSVTVNPPSARTCPVPITFPAALRTCTMAPGSPTPVSVTPSVTARSVGWSGAVKSGVSIDVAAETLPAASVRSTRNGLPSITAGFRETVKLPSAAAEPVPIRFPWASRTLTVAPGSPRPLNWLPPGLTIRSVGAAGGVLSTGVSRFGAVTAALLETLPAASCAVTASD